jgi:hypothetical protein
MSKHEYKDQQAKKDLDIILSRLNALEVSTTDSFQKSIIGVIRVLVETQVHSLNEFDHLKKAIDLLTLQIFKTQNKTS